VLSGGERQMLAISIALMTRPKLLLLDEPSAGLAPILVQRMFEMIAKIRDQFGMGVLLVEQNVNEALRICDDACVLEEGRVVFNGPASEKDEIVRRLWRLDKTAH
jgi:branched-chain amino acid transport system ATP-binding protein